MPLGENQPVLAIVSPCSTCKNKRETRSTDGKPYCPRVAVQNRYQAIQDQGRESPSLYPQALSGTDSPSKLVNPVHSPDDQVVLVWYAAVAENPARYDASGALVNPDILDPNFDTDWIQCRTTPVIPGLSHAQYESQGAFREGDQIVVFPTPRQQGMTGVRSGDSSEDELAPVGGVAVRSTHSFQWPILPVKKHEGSHGT